MYVKAIQILTFSIMALDIVTNGLDWFNDSSGGIRYI